MKTQKNTINQKVKKNDYKKTSEKIASEMNYLFYKLKIKHD